MTSNDTRAKHQEEQEHPTMTWSAFFSALRNGGVTVRSTPATSTAGRRGGQVANGAVNSDAGTTKRSASTQAQTTAKPTPRTREEAMDNWEFMVLDVSAANQPWILFISSTRAGTELPDYSLQRCLLHPRFLCRSLVSHVCHGFCLGNQVEGLASLYRDRRGKAAAPLQSEHINFHVQVIEILDNTRLEDVQK